MKKNVKKIPLAVMALFMMLGSIGCTGGSGESQNANPLNIAYVVGIADGETKLNDGFIDQLAAIPAKPNTDYAFVSVEGEPATILEGTIPDLSTRGYNEAMMERCREGIKSDLIDQLESYEPVAPEIDIAAAVELSVRTLNAHAVEGRQNVLVFHCSGKSTKGLINMIETPVYELDVESSVAAVVQKMNADMSGIDVIWYCCGDLGTGNAQPQLSASEKERMQAFYEQLFTALGAESVTFKNDLPSNECYHFAAAPVSCMAVEGTVSGLVELAPLEPETFENADEALLETPIVIPETKVQYKPDSAEFLDPNSVTEVIQPVVEFLLEYSDVNILLYGTCAGDSDSEYTLSLSKARAESVKKILVDAGIDANRITAIAVKAADDPYYQYGLGTGAEASVNRKTVMVDSSTEFAQQILSNTDVSCR